MAICLGVYFYTLSRTVAPGDSTEMVTAAVVLGVPHQPGYPVNTLLGHLVAKLPISTNKIVLINGVSATLQAITVGVFFLFVSSITASSIAGFVGAVFLGFSLIFWQYATKFEVFPLNNLFVVLILWLSFKKNRWMGLVSGLAITHHQTVVLIIPAILIWWGKKIFDPRIILGFALGVIPYFVLMLGISSRNPVMNWGNVKTIKDVALALMRSDYGTLSPYLADTGPVYKTYPIDQINYYMGRVVDDFTLPGVILVGIGVAYLLRYERKMLMFVVTGVVVSGWIFLAYANFPLTDSFNQATVRRFHMLPNIFVAVVLSFGVVGILKYLQNLKIANLGKYYLLALSVFPIAMNFSKANHRNIDLTHKFMLDSVATTPKDALIMVSGDIPVMTLDYLNEVEEKSQRIGFTPGQFHLGWKIPQLVDRYLDLEIPLPYTDKRFTTATQIVDANYGKFPIFIGPDLVARDPELEKKYVLYPQSLMFLVKAPGEDLKLEQYREENQILWDKLDIKQMQKIRKNAPSFEEQIVFYYARHFYNVGYVFDEVKLFDDAIREYKRALQIDPGFREAMVALGRVYGIKMENPDHATAIDYLRRYQANLGRGEEDYYWAAEELIKQIYE